MGATLGAGHLGTMRRVQRHSALQLPKPSRARLHRRHRRRRHRTRRAPCTGLRLPRGRLRHPAVVCAMQRDGGSLRLNVSGPTGTVLGQCLVIMVGASTAGPPAGQDPEPSPDMSSNRSLRVWHPRCMGGLPSRNSRPTSCDLAKGAHGRTGHAAKTLAQV